MTFVSTRGASPAIGWTTALLSGTAPDGGLWAPAAWPRRGPDGGDGPAPCDPAALVAWLLAPFADGATGMATLHAAAQAAFARFETPALAPLRAAGPGLFVLELFHGPTLAFKDVAMTLLARLIEDALAREGRKATILVATSGDTGAAAVEAFRGRSNIRIVVLHPKGRIAEAQRLQMTTALEANVLNLAVEGTFDDCQRIVKALFADDALREALGLMAANSINAVRVLIQMVYYALALQQLGAARFVVPTGNLGNAMAADALRRMGWPVAEIVAATNENDPLPRLWRTGRYAPGTARATASPSMDIQAPSNLERLLYEIMDRDGAAVSRFAATAAAEGAVTLGAVHHARFREALTAMAIPEDAAAGAMRSHRRETGVLVDPHTAVGLAAAARGEGPPVVVLATAHPAKFAPTVQRWTGERPEVPGRLMAKLGGAERYIAVPPAADAVAEIVRRS